MGFVSINKVITDRSKIDPLLTIYGSRSVIHSNLTPLPLNAGASNYSIGLLDRVS